MLSVKRRLSWTLNFRKKLFYQRSSVTFSDDRKNSPNHDDDAKRAENLNKEVNSEKPKPKNLSGLSAALASAFKVLGAKDETIDKVLTSTENAAHQKKEHFDEQQNAKKDRRRDPDRRPPLDERYSMEPRRAPSVPFGPPINYDAMPFDVLFRRSKFVELGDPNGKVVVGRITKVVQNDLYIDFGGKFPCVCKCPPVDGDSYTVGKLVRIRLHDIELSTKFLGSSIDLTLLEADATLLGLFRTRRDVERALGKNAPI